MSKPEHYYLEDSLVLFIDFLGFSHFADAANSEETTEMLDTLIHLSKLQGEHKHEIVNTSDFSREEWESPAVTTFSDHVVASFPLAVRSKSDDELPAIVRHSMLMASMANLTVDVAATAIHLGMLIRGGLTIGKLYHERSVVYGPAMIEAHEIESRIANYPRIVVSPKAYDLVGTNSATIRRDDDGLYYLDYLSVMRMYDRAPIGRYRGVLQKMQDVAEREVQRHEKNQSLAALAKWFWFKTKLANHSIADEDTKIPGSFPTR